MTARARGSERGERLHYWVFGGAWTYGSEPKGEPTGEDAAWLAEGTSRVGAVVGGRWTHEAAGHWGGENPWGLPFFIVTHRPEEEPEGGAFTFVSGVDNAVERAVEGAGGKDVDVMGGAEIIRQAIAAGLVDELTIIIAPVILGAGKRLCSRASRTRWRWTAAAPPARFRRDLLRARRRPHLPARRRRLRAHGGRACLRSARRAAHVRQPERSFGARVAHLHAGGLLIIRPRGVRRRVGSAPTAARARRRRGRRRPDDTRGKPCRHGGRGRHFGPLDAVVANAGFQHVSLCPSSRNGR